MTKFNNLVKILEKNNEKKTVFTHYIDIKSDVNLDIIDIKKNKIETEEIEFC